MAAFLDKYVRDPIEHLISDAPDHLPEIRARMDGDAIYIGLGEEEMRISRENGDEHGEDEHDQAPDDQFSADL